MNLENRRLLADLLIQWEDLYKQGQDTPADVLCKDHPELAETLARQIAALKRVSWLDEKLEDDGDESSGGQEDTPRPPKLLAGRYRLDEVVATGGFAEVWRAFDQQLQRIIAVKIPKRTVVGSSESFLAEARRVARLKHPAILPVYDVGLDGDDCFFVSEYVEGGSLADRLARGKLPVDQACQWISSIADALDHAHRAGVIHRDVKPANILIDAHGRALLADFGIAQSSMKTGSLAPSLGTLRYMAPEQLAGQEALPQSDIYSLAVVLHECLARKPPYSSGEPNTLRREIGSGAEVSRDVPKSLGPTLRKALNKDPGQRHATAAEFATLLKHPPRHSSRLGMGLTAAAAAIALVAGTAALAPKLRPLRAQPSLPARSRLVRPQGETVTNSIGMQLRAIPKGTFVMGSDDADPKERPSHEVHITKPFYVGVHEVTNAAWKRVMGDVPSEWPEDDKPVVNITWHQAVEFCEKLSELPEEKAAGRSFRLPTEAEWEYACRADSTSLFPFGSDAALLGEYAWLTTNSDLCTHPVGQKKPNQWGLYDIQGNVWEWCSDRYGAYDRDSVADPIGSVDGSERVARGNGWGCSPDASCASSRRGMNDCSARLPYLGFRVAMDAPSSPYPPEFDKPIKINSARDTLENYLVQLSQHTGIAISINTQELQRQGITKNQSFGLDVTDRPAREVLPLILNKADQQERLRAVRRATEDGQTAIEITTSQALEKHK